MTLQSTKLDAFSKGQAVCLQGEAATCLYILRKGSVAIYVSKENAIECAEQIIATGVQVATINEPGSLIGEGGMFIKHRTASIIATTKGTVVESVPISDAGLQAVMIERPQLAMTLCRSLASRLCAITEQLKDIALTASAIQSAYDKVALGAYRVLGDIKHCAENNPALTNLCESLEETPLFIQGRHLDEDRASTCMMFNHDASQKRQGTVTLKKGQQLCEEGKMGRALYLVRSGSLEVRLGSMPLSTIGPDEIVGEISVLLRETPKRTANVIATRDSTLLCIATSKFYELIDKNPAFLVPIARSLACRLDTTNHFLSSHMHGGDGDKFALLAGTPGSCEGQLTLLAASLGTFPECKPMMDAAQRLASQAGNAHRELLRDNRYYAKCAHSKK